MPAHPEAELFVCPNCTHAFSKPESIAHAERFDSSYAEEAHKRWFAHPNIKLFRRVADVIPTGVSVLDVGCGQGDFLRYLSTLRPDLKLTGIDLAPNPDVSGIRFLQGDVLTTEFDEHFDVVPRWP